AQPPPPHPARRRRYRATSTAGRSRSTSTAARATPKPNCQPASHQSPEPRKKASTAPSPSTPAPDTGPEQSTSHRVTTTQSESTKVKPDAGLRFRRPTPRRYRQDGGTGPWCGGRPRPPPHRPVSSSAAPAAGTALCHALLREPSVGVAWQSWRLPDNNAPWPPARQVFVVETEPDADLPALTARLQHVLAAAGEVNPQVEVYPTRREPPAYQQ